MKKHDQDAFAPIVEEEEPEEKESRSSGCDLDALALMEVDDFLCDMAEMGSIRFGYGCCPA